MEEKESLNDNDFVVLILHPFMKAAACGIINKAKRQSCCFGMSIFLHTGNTKEMRFRDSKSYRKKVCSFSLETSKGLVQQHNPSKKIHDTHDMKQEIREQPQSRTSYVIHQRANTCAGSFFFGAPKDVNDASLGVCRRQSSLYIFKAQNGSKQTGRRRGWLHGWGRIMPSFGNEKD